MGDINPFVALVSGGQGAHGLRAEFAWDGENRLVRVGPADGQKRVGDRKIEFVYDYLGRRIELRAYFVPDWTPVDWTLVKRRRFVWSGWLMLVEVDAGVDTPAVNNPLRRYTWGLDLGGTAVSAVDAGYGAPALQAVGHGGPALQGTSNGDWFAAGGRVPVAHFRGMRWAAVDTQDDRCPWSRLPRAVYY